MNADELPRLEAEDYAPAAAPALGEVLDAAATMLGRYVAFPTGQARWAVTLWVAHTWAIDAFGSTPRLHLKSAEKQSGKTRTQEVAAELVHRPIPTANVTTAALFRSISDERPPTLLLDEVDTIFGPKAPDGSEELRGLLNAGHRRGKPILRCFGPSHAVTAFASFAPACLAGIGSLPDTIEDRAVVITMRRRAPGEHVEPFRQRTVEAEAAPIRDALAAMSAELTAALDGYYPELPDWLTDRPADVWEPLIAIADHAGGQWPDRARDAAAVLLGERDESDVTIAVRLLAEVRDVFDDDAAIHTDELLARLHRLEESPWGEWDISPRWLAAKLKPFGIRSKNVRLGDKQAKGYEREEFHDSWTRYLSVPASQASQASDQPQRQNGSVPGTDRSVPTSHQRPADQGRDGGTDGTEPRPGDGRQPYDETLAART